MGNCIPKMNRGMPANCPPQAVRDTRIPDCSALAIMAADIMQIRQTRGMDNCISVKRHTETGNPLRGHEDIETVLSQDKQFMDKMIANAWIEPLESPPRLAHLAVKACFPPLNSRADFDDMATRLTALTDACPRLEDPVLAGTALAWRNAMSRSKSKDVRQALAEEGVKQGHSPEKVAAALKLDPKMRGALDLYAAKITESHACAQTDPADQ